MKYFILTLLFFLLFPIIILGQYHKVKGIVTDEKENPIANVVLFPKNMFFSELGGRTSEQGIFEVVVPKDSILIVEHILYETQYLTLKELEKRHFHIKLNDRIELLDILSINSKGYSVKTSNEIELRKQAGPSNSIFQKDFELGVSKLNSFKLSEEEEHIQIHIYGAEFPGGNINLMKTMYEKLSPLVPLIEKNEKPLYIEVSFTINPLGYCKDVRLMQKTGTSIDDEIVNAIQTMPRWKPAIQLGRPVFSKFIFPFSFMSN